MLVVEPHFLLHDNSASPNANMEERESRGHPCAPFDEQRTSLARQLASTSLQ